MLFTIAVDANPILAALLGGYARTVLFDPRFCFVTTAFTLTEVVRYLPVVEKKSGIPLVELETAIALLPLQQYDRATYSAIVEEAERRMKHIDPDDVDILALVLHFEALLWTHDSHFDKIQPPVKIVQTKDFIL